MFLDKEGGYFGGTPQLPKEGFISSTGFLMHVGLQVIFLKLVISMIRCLSGSFDPLHPLRTVVQQWWPAQTGLGTGVKSEV